MSSVPYSNEQLADDAAAFAEKITPPKERWAYCFERASYVYRSLRYGAGVCLNDRTFPVVDRIAGCFPGGAKFRLGKIKQLGLDGAFEADAKARRFSTKPWFYVGPMQAWHVGHVYFARVETHPHVLKVGFSRRVHDRLDDIEAKVKAKLVMLPGEIRVGTLADEHWWHKNWEKSQISGEWFFDPHMTDRSLPAFLAVAQSVEAA